MRRRWSNWIRIDLEYANMVLHDRVIDSAVLDSGHVKDLAKSGFVWVRLDVHPFSRRLRRRRAIARPFDRPVGAEEELAPLVIALAPDEHREAQCPQVRESAHIEIIDAVLAQMPQQLEPAHRPHRIIEAAIAVLGERVPDDGRPLCLLRAQALQVSEYVRPRREGAQTKGCLVRGQTEPAEQLSTGHHVDVEILLQPPANRVLMMPLTEVIDHGTRRSDHARSQQCSQSTRIGGKATSRAGTQKLQLQPVKFSIYALASRLTGGQPLVMPLSTRGMGNAHGRGNPFRA